MPNNEKNPFDDAAAAVMQQDAQSNAVQIRNNMQYSVGQNPDQAAKYQHLAKYVGVPVETVQAQPEAIQQQAALKSMDADKLVADYPSLGRYLIDPANAAKSHDDIAPMAAVEKAAKALPAPAVNAAPPTWGETISGLPMELVKGLGGAFNKAAGSVNTVLGAFPTMYDQAASLVTGEYTRDASDKWFGSMVDPRLNDQKTFEVAPNARFASKAVNTTGNLVGMLSQIVLTGGGGQVSTGAVGTAEVVAAQAAHGAKAMAFPALSDSVDTARRVYLETGDGAAAARAAQMQYGTSTLAGVVPLSAPGSVATRAAGGFVSGAVTGEVSRNAMNLVLPTSMAQGYDTENLILSGLTGSLLGTSMGPRKATPVYDAAIRQTYADANRAEASERGMAALQGLSELAAASKTRERDPDGFKAFVRDATENGQLQEVYVDANALAEVLNQSGVDIATLGKAMPELAAQFREAVETNGDVRIPVEDYATHIAGGKLDAALLPHLKVEPDGFTYQQGQEYFQNQQAEMKVQAETILAAKEADDAAAADALTVHDTVLEQLNANGRFRPEVNAAYAALTRDFYTTMAERSGMTPGEMYAKYPLKITSEALFGGLDQGERGSFNPETNTISMLKGADLSTYLHESGHFFLETMHSMARGEGAPEGIRADFDTLLASFGEKGDTPEQRLADWSGKTLEQKRAAHEQFARGFEAYLMEGKAPTLEQQGIYSRFRSWLVNIYKSLSNLNVELTPEVRGVMDRMLATDAAIQQAEQARGYLPMDKPPEGTTAEQFAEYQAQGRAATEQAVADMNARSIRDMQWASNAKSKAMRALQKQADAQRKAIREEVEREVEAQPVEQARKWLTKGIMLDAEGAEIKAEKGFRLNSEVLKEMYPETALGRPEVAKLRGMTAKDGLHPDMVAEMFGFESGEALVRVLIDSNGKAKELIDGLVDQRMLERHGELIDGPSIERAAEASIHNEARARFMATGLKLLSKSPVPARLLAKAAQERADEAIAARKIKDLRPAQHSAAEARANREAIKLAPKDPQGAVQAQRAALLNNRLFKAASDAVLEVQKGVEYLKRLERVPAQSKMRGEFLEQVNALLERFDLRTSTPAEATADRVPLAEWIVAESDRLSAVVPDLPAWVLNEGTRTSFKNLRVEEFRGLMDAVKQLEMLARREQNQYMAIRAMKFADERGAILGRIREFNPKAFDAEGEPNAPQPDFVPSIGKAVSKLGDKFAGEFLNAENILGILEGGQYGQVHESLFGRMSSRADWKATRLGDIYKLMKPLFKQYSLAERLAYSRKDIGSAIGLPLTRENALVVALLHGNAEGRERLTNYGWNEAKQQQIISLLDGRDMKLADGIWRLFDENLWPELKSLNDRTRGKSPPKVEALPYATAHGEARGGYFRLKYDTNLDERAHRLDEGAAVKELLGGGMGMSNKTNQGSSTERKQGVSLRPRLDLGVFAESVNETVHDLAFREAVADTTRLLNDKGIQNAIKSVAGVPSYRALVTRVREVAAPPRNPSGFIENAVSIARKNTVVVLMSGVKTALQNFTGLIPALSRVNAGSLGVELAKFYGPRMKEMYEFAHSQSEYMKNRHQSFDRDLQGMATQLTVNGKIMPETGTWLALMGVVDKAVSVPVWNAAFKDGMKAHDNDATMAAAYADHIVRQTQGSGREVDLAAIMSGHGGYGQLKRVFTMFYSYFNGQLGMLVRSGAINRKAAAENPALAAAKFASDFLLVFVLPAVLTEMFFRRRRPDEDDETEEQTAKRYARAMTMYGAGMIPVVRDLASFTWATFDHDAANYGYKISPVQSAGEGVVNAAVSIGDVAAGEGDEKDAKDIIMGAGYAFGLPGKLISDTTLGTMAWLEGRAGPEAIAFGPPRK